MPGLVHAERAVIMPVRSEVQLTPSQLATAKAAQEQALQREGLEPVHAAPMEPCAELACVEAQIAQASAQHAVELALWRSQAGSISGASVSVLTQAGERFSEGAELETDGDLSIAIARATAGAYVRMRRGPGPWLELSGTPEGANITVDGEMAGILPARVKVRGGLHRVRISRDGFEPFEATVTVARNADALKQLSISLPVSSADPFARISTEGGPRSRAWSYVLAGIGVAASAVLAIGPLRSAAQDGECGRYREGMCTGVVAFDGAQGLQLAAAALLLGAGVTVAVWAPP